MNDSRLAEAVDVVTGLLGGGPFTYDGRFHRARAVNLPPAHQEPPRVFVGGKAIDCSMSSHNTPMGNTGVDDWTYRLAADIDVARAQPAARERLARVRAILEAAGRAQKQS